jgi:DUF1680 family protein
LEENVKFPLYLRIPGWAAKLQLSISTESAEIENQQGRYIKIEREWSNNDEVSLEFKPEMALTQWPRTKSVTLNRGPLSYSVRIKENWVKTETDQFGWDKWEVLPVSEWNYGLVLEDLNLNENIRVKRSEIIPDQPWEQLICG